MTASFFRLLFYFCFPFSLSALFPFLLFQPRRQAMTAFFPVSFSFFASRPPFPLLFPSVAILSPGHGRFPFISYCPILIFI